MVGGGANADAVAVAVASASAMIAVDVISIDTATTAAAIDRAAVDVIVHNVTAVIRLRTCMSHVHFNLCWYKIPKCIFDTDGRF